MIYKEVKGDLFTAPIDNILVHCISADHAMGAGIAKRFTEMGIKTAIGGSKDAWNGIGYAVITKIKSCPWMVCNLVTKEKYWMKPTYKTLKQALEELKIGVTGLRDYNKIAMPQIGCGLDKLKWSKVSTIIQEMFTDTDVEITVYIKE